MGYDRDFYLAELNVDDDGTADVSDDSVATDFYITFNANGQNKYRIQRKNADELSFEFTFGFKSQEGIAAYAAFWRRYKRPPRKDYWNYIVKRLDLLVPQDVRERKGAFFTPQKWVELSQEYLARELWRYYHRQPGANPNAQIDPRPPEAAMARRRHNVVFHAGNSALKSLAPE